MNNASNPRNELVGNQYNILAFILGFSACNDVISIISYGSSKINISTIYSLMLFLVLLVFRQKVTVNSFKIVSKWFYYVMICILVSFIPCMVYFIGNIGLLSRYFNGLLFYILYSTSMICVIALRNQRKFIVRGLFIGFLFNICITYFAYTTYMGGQVFTLFRAFPQSSFYIPTYNFRAQGMFLEPSYFSAFITSIIIILLYDVPISRLKQLFVLIVSAYAISLTKSGNIVIFIASLICFWLMPIFRAKVNKRRIFITLLSVCMLSLGGIAVFAFWDKIREIESISNIVTGILGANPTDVSNIGRYQNIQMALRLVLPNILGIGWNMSHSLLELVYGVTMGTYTSHSFIVTLMLELGLVGTLVYFVFLGKISFGLLSNGKNNYQHALGISLIAMFLCQISNGNRLYNYMFILFGLAMVESYDNIRKTYAAVGNVAIVEGKENYG